MLKSIECDFFKQGGINGASRGPIVFHKGLNTILGGVNGENSIGKTMLLLAIDFALGGKTYKGDLFDKQLSSQELKITFEFENTLYYFVRSTDSFNIVWECDASFKKLKSLSLDDFKNFLRLQYKADLPYLTFRDMLGRYFRVYGMDNCYEKEPLRIGRETKYAAINSLLKLFNCYEQYKTADDELKKIDKARTTLKNAREMEFVSGKITTKRAFSANERKIQELGDELNNLVGSTDENITKTFLVNSENIGNLETELRILKRKRSWLINRLAIINDNINSIFHIDDVDLADLVEFFPGSNVKKISEVESFHKKMQELLENQMTAEASEVENEISELSARIEDLMFQQHKLGKTISLSKEFLNRYNELTKKIAVLKKENEAFKKTETLKMRYKTQQKTKEKAQRDAFDIILEKINKQMEELCLFIYEGKQNSPIFDLKTESKYNLTTENDSGMGTSFKSLIVFDLSVLKLSVLPAIAHDTLIFKNIEDKHFKKILRLYNSISKNGSNKQIFIACDKQNSYDDEVKKILTDTSVIKLGPNGEELFGYSWAKKTAEK